MVVWNLPNAITLSRLVASVGVFVLAAIPGLELWAAVAFAVVAVTDAVDGAIARALGQVTTFGRILDPFVDKVLVIGTLLFLLARSGEGGPADPGVRPTMVAVIAFREMFVTALRAEAEKLGADFSADRLGKLKMTAQCVAIVAVLLGIRWQLFGDDAWRLARDATLWAVTALTGWSGVVSTRRAFRAIAAAD